MEDFNFERLHYLENGSLAEHCILLSWELLAAFGWLFYKEYGRGVVVVDMLKTTWVADILVSLEGGFPAALHYKKAADITPFGKKVLLEIQTTQDFIEIYDPEKEVVLLVIWPNAEAQYGVLSGVPVPPEASPQVLKCREE